MEPEQQIAILREAWELVSRANALLGTSGLDPRVEPVRKDVLTALNRINEALNATSGFKRSS